MLPSNEISFLFFNLVNGIFIPEKNANSLYKMYQTSQYASLQINCINCQNYFASNGTSFCVFSTLFWVEMEWSGGHLGRVGDDENSTIPNKMYLHLNKILCVLRWQGCF